MSIKSPTESNCCPVIEQKELDGFRKNVNQKKEKIFLSVKEVAELVSYDQKTIRRWIDRGKLPAGKLGTEWRIYVDDLYVFFRKCCNSNKIKEERGKRKGENG